MLHWQFSPVGGISVRDTEVVLKDQDLSTNVASPECYQDYWLIITGPDATTTNTPALSYTPTQTRTRTNTPTITPTPTDTPTATPNAKLVGHVTWQGPSPQPDSKQQLPITLTVRLNGTPTNYTGLTTDASGFFTVSVQGMPNGTYAWRVKNPKYLAVTGTVTLAGAAQTNAEMGLQKAGDANNSNNVDATDFNILKLTFGKTTGQVGYDERADWTHDDLVSSLDFVLLKSNFGTAGRGPIRPIGRGIQDRYDVDAGHTMEKGSQSYQIGQIAVKNTAPAPTPLNTKSSIDTTKLTGSSDGAKDLGSELQQVRRTENTKLYRDLANASNPASPNVVQTLIYFHGDHLGSVSVTSSSSGALVSQQEFDPWGKVRFGNITQTQMNFTGQKLDDTGLLFYNARYYDPGVGRFVSADSLVPGSSVATIADFHEGQFLSALNANNKLTSNKDRWSMPAPADPASLNRYSGMGNNPANNNDPSGHFSCNYKGCGGRVINNSDYPVKIFGTYVDGREKSCTAENQPIAGGGGREEAQCTDLNQGTPNYGKTKDFALQGWRTLKAHTSSVDIGMYDVDVISAEDDNTKIDGHGMNERFKLGTNQTVSLENSEIHAQCEYGPCSVNLSPGSRVHVGSVETDKERSRHMAEWAGKTGLDQDTWAMLYYIGAKTGFGLSGGGWRSCGDPEGTRCSHPVAGGH